MNDFEKLVLDMRTAQQEYFRSRSQASLSKAKGLERAVDAHLKSKMNPDLFANGKT